MFHIFFTPKYISIAIIAIEGGKNKYCEQGTTDVQSVKVIIQDYSPPSAARPFMCELQVWQPAAARPATHTKLAHCLRQ